MKQIVNKFDKHKINDLPRVVFPGRIIVVMSEYEAERAVEYLLRQPIIGLDTETKPCFTRRRGMNQVSLLQVSSEEVCFLFRLNHMGLTDALVTLLSDTKVTKVALSWHDDLRQLRRRRDFTPGTYVELQDYVKEIGIDDMSLQKLYANLFGQKISKAQRLSNWENDHFSMAQQEYAATDAWTCIQLYKEVKRLAETGDYELTVVPEPEPAPRPEPATEDVKDKVEEKKKTDKKRRPKRKSNGRKSIKFPPRKAKKARGEAEESSANLLDELELPF